MNAVGRDIGLPPDHQVNDIAELLAFPLSCPEKKRALGVFLRWMSELYQYNGAVEFGATPNFPSYDPISGVVTSNTLIMAQAPSLIDLSSHRTIRTTVSFPPMKALLNIPPTELLRVRNDKGPPYFAALGTWQREPNLANEIEFLRSLEQYSITIVRWSAKEQGLASGLLDVVIGSQATPGRKLLTALLATGGNAASAIAAIYEPWVTPFIELGGGLGGYAMYHWRAQRTEDALLEFATRDHGGKSLPELNFPLGP